MESPGEVAKWSKIFCMGAFLVAVLSFFPFLLFYNTVDETGFAAHPISLIVSGVLLFGSVSAGLVSFILYAVAQMWDGPQPGTHPVEGSAPAVPATVLAPPVRKWKVLRFAVAILLWMIASTLLFALVAQFYAGFSTHLPPGP